MAQIDPDADATCKGGRYYFGYKDHIGVDVGSKLIRRLSFTPPPPDSTQLENLLSGDERAIFGDKAYPSKALKSSAAPKTPITAFWTTPTATPR